MKLKPITFRCTTHQLERIRQAMLNSPVGNNRTEFISAALHHFLDFVESREGKQMNLWQLVDKIDTAGSQIPFGKQA